MKVTLQVILFLLFAGIFTALVAMDYISDNAAIIILFWLMLLMILFKPPTPPDKELRLKDYIDNHDYL